MPDETHLRVFIEDDPRLGPWFCPAAALPPSSAEYVEGLCLVPADQARRWQDAMESWERAQREMRPYLEQRQRELLTNIGRHAGVEAAQRAEERLTRRSARR